MRTGILSLYQTTYMNDEMNEIRKRMDQEKILKEQMAYEMLVKNGDEWIRKNGQEKLLQEIEYIRVNLRVWNKLTKSTMVLNLQTIDAMLQLMSTVPFIVGTDIIRRPEYAEYTYKLSAIRNHLIKERNEKLLKANPFLSTGTDEKL